MFNGIGVQEILLIGVLVLLLFGPRGVSGVMRDLGRWTGKLKRYRDDFTRELAAIEEPELTPAEIRKKERERIRRERRKAMAELPADERKNQSEEIMKRVQALDEYRNARRIMCFLSLSNEVDTLPLVCAALAEGKEVAVPYCLPAGKSLGLALITDPPGACVRPGIYNIPEPLEHLREGVDLLTVDLFIIPGVAFDYERNRLGRGAGYFDLFLAPIAGKKPVVALAFNEQIYPYTIPPEAHDVKPDLVITPLSVIGKKP